MKIEKIETVQVPPRWGLLRVLAGDGVEGYGEYTLEGQLAAAEAAVHELGEFFLGKDPTRVKALVRGCYGRSFHHGGAVHMSALGGIETALWDLAGKAAGLPVHRLLGGRVRDRVKVYRRAGGNNTPPRRPRPKPPPWSPPERARSR